MDTELSNFGKRFAGKIGIAELMDDLGSALAADPAPLMLGGGNPAHIHEVQVLIRQRMSDIMDQPGEFERLIGNYDTPQGAAPFRQALADMFNHEYDWGIGPENIALTNGSQNAFVSLFNLFAGRFEGSRKKQIMLPLTPEYIGYTEVGMEPDFFLARRPKIEQLEDYFFKYRIDFEGLHIGKEVGALCLSRPTNPTGNVVTNEEIEQLRTLARSAGVPLILDNAYGAPFPSIIQSEVTPVWDKDMVLCLSLSKFGLPTLRTGIVIARKEIIQLVSRITSVFSLAPGSLGPALALELVRSGEILEVSRKIIRPFYAEKSKRAVAQLQEELNGLPYAIHKPEGALFLWLWLKDLPITTEELYQRLKAKGVLVVPGHYFFPGLNEPWQHKDECIRITFAQSEDVVSQGLTILTEEVRRLY
ncbi:MAG: valine--pyruvate transaminase [Opitutales bacterium]